MAGGRGEDPGVLAASPAPASQPGSVLLLCLRVAMGLGVLLQVQGTVACAGKRHLWLFEPFWSLLEEERIKPRDVGRVSILAGVCVVPGGEK